MCGNKHDCKIDMNDTCCEAFETTRLGSVELHDKSCQCNQSPSNTEMSEQESADIAILKEILNNEYQMIPRREVEMALVRVVLSMLAEKEK